MGEGRGLSTSSPEVFSGNPGMCLSSSSRSGHKSASGRERCSSPLLTAPQPDLSSFSPCVTPLAGEHRLLLQLRQRGPGGVPVCGVQGAPQRPPWAELRVQPQNQGEPPASACRLSSLPSPLRAATPAFSLPLPLHTHNPSHSQCHPSHATRGPVCSRWSPRPRLGER